MHEVMRADDIHCTFMSCLLYLYISHMHIFTALDLAYSDSECDLNQVYYVGGVGSGRENEQTRMLSGGCQPASKMTPFL